jgi:IclR family pca regulon transcriptional regulator
MKEVDDREYVQSLERGLSVLQSFSAQHARMTLSEVAARTDLTRATARRFLITLARLNLVGSDGKYFWLLPGILDLGYRYLSGLPWWQHAQPIIEDISSRMQEPCSISVIDGESIVYVARAAVNRILSSSISIGSRFPAFVTAMGRAILAQRPDDEIVRFLASIEPQRFTDKTVLDRDKLLEVMQTCRRKGYAISDGELEPNLRGLAVPIFDASGRAVAALGISVHSGTESQASLLKRGLPMLIEASQRITRGVQNQEFQPSGSMRSQ